MFHTTTEIKNMTSARLRNFILGYCQVGSTRELKKVMPVAKRFDLRTKSGCMGLYTSLNGN